MKRIALISYHTCPLASQEGKESGGMNVYVLELAKQLVKMGYVVDIFTRIQDEISPEIVDFLPNMRVIHLKAGPKFHINKKQLINHIGEFSKNIAYYARKNSLSYEVLHAHYYLSGLIALDLKKHYSFNLPIVTTFHTLALMKNLVARDSKERESMVRIKAEFRLVRESNRIIASSEHDREYLMSLYDCPEEKIKVITPGVNGTLFHPIPKKEALSHIQSLTKDKIILFVGRIEPLKGIDVLMYAIKIYLHRNPKSQVRLLIVGGSENNETTYNNKELARLKVLQHTLGISPVVGFITQRTQQELPYYYNAAEVMVMPSHYESFGMTALEALACGTPVITTDTAGISHLLDENFQNMVISANNPMLIAEQIEWVINDEKRQHEQKIKILEHVRLMTWECVAKKSVEVYSL